MNVLIVGAGAVGYNLAQQLSSEGHNIAVVDASPARTRRLNDALDVLAIEGEATSPSSLTAARIQDADMLVAVTDSDEVNMVACLLASHYEVKWKIARVRNPEISTSGGILGPEELQVDFIINPDLATVESMVRIIETPGALEVADFSDGAAMLLGFDVPANAPIVGKKVTDLREGIEEFPLIVAISRGEEVIVPGGMDTIEAEDNIYIIVHRDTLPFFLPCVNRRADEVEKVIIYGGTRTAALFAQRLEKKRINVTLIEPDKEQADYLVSHVSSSLVLRGQATDRLILEQAHVEMADFFVALSEDDNSNLMAALLARKLGAKKLMVMTSEPDYVPILESIDIDAVINPRIVTFNEILRLIRRGIVQNVVRIKDGRAEGIQLLAESGHKVVGQPLRKVSRWLPKNTIVGAIIRSGQMVIPDGESVIEQGDSVVIFGLPQSMPAVEKLFARKRLLGGS